MNPEFAYTAAQNPNYGMIGGQAGFASTDAPTPSTSVSKASDAMARAVDICLRIEALADRLCGSVPTAVTSTGNQIKGKGPAFCRSSKATLLNWRISFRAPIAPCLGSTATSDPSAGTPELKRDVGAIIARRAAARILQKYGQRRASP